MIKKIQITHHKVFKHNLLIVNLFKKNDFSNTFLRLLEFKNWRTLDKTLLNKDEFLKWYKVIMQTEYDTMLYGLYVPNALIKDFLKTYYTDLTEDEQVVFNEATKYLKIKVDNSQIKFSGNVNIIVINNNLAKFDSYNPEHILLHELSHFIFNYVKDYRVLVSEAFNSLERKTAKKIVKEYMFKKGNSTIEHIADEWAAQLVSVYNNKKTKNKNIVALKKYFKDILKIDENNIYQHQP